ncbi:cutinase family protein [Gordonia sp. (in: high G+C Gram-positive bacteria)]|uniref:cutinase family protein n=1 Tax=Gordonia sp. (in: high G+C Gram-positive bacteria) TaxID=84139 RepID=UPI003C72AFB0
MLSTLMKPMLAMAGSNVARAYVPYPAGFGGAVAGGSEPFDESVQKGLARTKSMTKQIAAKCGDQTKFAYAGYSQGGYIVSLLLKEIAAGKGPISAETVAGAATFGDPSRAAGADVFPGKPGANTPEPAPGTAGTAVSQLTPRNDTAAAGGGIGPSSDQSPDYGELTGRVATFCETGDLACDAPSDAPVAHIVTNIAGQTKFSQDDPVQTLGSLAEALAFTSARTIVPVINEDLSGETLEDLSYQPNETISQRIADASDPRAPLPTIDDSLKALLKVGTIGLNAVVTVAKKVLNPVTLTQLGTVGLANPPAALGLLAGKVAEATIELVPPATTSRWTTEAFDAVKANVSDNKELLDVSNMVRYWQTAQQHGSYSKPTANGQSATLWTAAWFASLAADLAGKGDFKPFDDNGIPTADAELANFYRPSLPASPTSARPGFSTPSTSETPPWSTGTVTITDTETATPDSDETATSTPASEPVPSS